MQIKAIIYFITFSLTSTAEIIRPPSDVTVFLGESAVFECEVDSDFSGWRVNGTPLNRLEPEFRNDLMTPDPLNTEEGNGIIQLIIPGRAEYNGTIVQCVIPGSQESENVTMNVQGLLSAVVNLRTASSDTSSITISWTAPYSLDVTDVDPDIWYSVLIYNVTDDESTLVSCTDCINITDTHYTFTPDSPSRPCHQYLFTIIPFNGAGQGETSQNITGYTIDGDFNVEFVRVDIRSISSEECYVAFQVCGEVEGKLVNYSFIVNEVIISQRNNVLIQSGGSLTYTLPANRRYSGYIITVGTTFITSDDNFTTYDVQDLTAIGYGSGITVRGEFISDTLATGCFVVIQSNAENPDIYRALLRQDSKQTVSATISVPPSNYTVYAYDLEENALPNPLPALSSGTPSTHHIISISTHIVFTTLLVLTDSIPTLISIYLSNATVSQSGSQVTITCQFYPESSCVLVYREYGNTTLTVIEYPHSTEFPVNVTVDNPERYTFAIFGKNGDVIDEEPAIAVKLEAIKPPPTPSSGSDSESPTRQSSFLEGLGVGIVVGVVSTSAVMIAIIIIIMKCKQLRGKKVPMKTNVAYEVHSGRISKTTTPLYEVCN